MENTYTYLLETESKVIPKIQEILIKERRNATGKLRNSFEIDIKDKQNNDGFEINMTYAAHGKYVLDNRRRIKKGPSSNAIQSIMDWIVNKGISIGGGKIRTPMGNARTQAQQDPLAKRRAFAFAIYYSIKKKGRTWANSTNFLKPWNNIYQGKPFRDGLAQAIGLDMGKEIQDMFKQNGTINIKT